MKLQKITLLFLVTYSTVFSQELPISEKTGKVTFTKVEEIRGTTQTEIYAKVKAWVVAGAGESSARKDLIKLDDKDSGRMVIETRVFITGLKTNSEESMYSHQEVKGNFFVCKIVFFIKDDKYKWEATDFYHHGSRSRDNMKDCGDVENQSCGSMRLNKIWDEIKLKLPGAVSKKMNSLQKTLRSNDMDF